jgi:autotransporter-associated beta strand protein
VPTPNLSLIKTGTTSAILRFDGDTTLAANRTVVIGQTIGGGPAIDTNSHNVTIAGQIVPNNSAAVSFNKQGLGTLTLTGFNTFSGNTILTNGTLIVGPASTNPILVNTGNAAGATINNGVLVFDYTGSSSPASVVVPLLKTSHDSLNFTDSTQRLRTSIANDPAHGIGYVDIASTLTLKYTWYGDANLDGTVNADDYALLDRGFNQHAAGWQNGDFDYSGTIDSNDYLLTDTSYLNLHPAAMSPSFLASRQSQFGSEYVSNLIAAVPEPSMIACLIAIPLIHRRRRNV